VSTSAPAPPSSVLAPELPKIELASVLIRFVSCSVRPMQGERMCDFYVTPLHAAVRKLLGEIGLNDRYEFWLKELVRINEEEAARAKRSPFPLWDFSIPNTITRETIPLPGDLTPMRWYWDHSHTIELPAISSSTASSITATRHVSFRRISGCA
jgi:hypothetical protein